MMNGYIVTRFLSFLSIIVIGLFIFGSAAQSAQLSGSGSGAQMTGDAGSGNVATPASQEQGQVSDQVQQQTHQAADLQEDEKTTIDLLNIPESAPNADWVFEVPVDVSNLPDEVNKIAIYCSVISPGCTETYCKHYGQAARILSLENDSYQGSVLIGVNYDGDNNTKDNDTFDRLGIKYNCSIWLVGPIDSSPNCSPPSTNPSSTPYWRRADPNRPFRWKTGAQPMPE